MLINGIIDDDINKLDDLAKRKQCNKINHFHRMEMSVNCML